jgi:hypothetical protein
VKYKGGTLINDKTKILSRWAEYFHILLNGEDIEQCSCEPNIQQLLSQSIMDPDQPPPTVEETAAAIKKLRNKKSPGSDSLPAEKNKSGGKALEGWIHEIMTEVRNSEVSPEEWNKGIIVPIHKKGSQLHCENFRGITLLNIRYKIFSNILYERLKPFVENIPGHYQKGFRASKSTTDQIFSLRQILEKKKHQNMA